MTWTVCEDPLVYYNDIPLPDELQALTAFAEACDRTKHRSKFDDAPEPYEAVKLLNAVKAQIIFFRSIGVYGDVIKGDASFYEKVYTGLTSAQNYLQMLDPDAHNAIISEAFMLAQSIEFTEAAEQSARSAGKKSRESPLTLIKRDRSVPEDDPSEPFLRMSRSKSAPPEPSTTLAVFARAGLLASTGADEEEKAGAYRYRQELPEFGQLPTFEQLRSQFRRLRGMTWLGTVARAGTVTILANVILYMYRSVGVPGMLAALLQATDTFVPIIVRETIGAGTSAMTSAVSKMVRAVLGPLRNYFELETQLQQMPVRTSSFMGLFSHYLGLWKQTETQQQHDVALGPSRFGLVRSTRKFLSTWNHRWATTLGRGFLDFFGVVNAGVALVMGDAAIAIGGSWAAAILSLALLDYHGFHKKRVREAFLRRHGAVDDSNWKVELEKHLQVLRDYYEEYYKHVRARRFYLDIDKELDRLKELVEDAYNARKRTRDHRKMKDDEKAQIEATNTYIKTMLDIREKILDLPQTWDHRQTLAQVMDQQALSDLKNVWGVDHGNDARAHNHYHNFQVWLYNEGLSNQFHRRMLFPPRGAPRVLHDDDTSDEDDDDEDDDDEDEEEGGDEGGGSSNPFDGVDSQDDDEDGGDDGAGALGPRRAASAPEESTRRRRESRSRPTRSPSPITPWKRQNANTEGSKRFLEERSKDLRASRSASAPEESPAPPAPPARRRSSPQRAKTVDASVVSYVFARLGL